MANQPTEGFIDNWAYLKTELSWLDRMLMMALARYRQDKKSVDKIAQSPADQASSHWWKGVISLDGKVAYDEHRPGAKVQGGGTNTTQKSNSPSNNQDSNNHFPSNQIPNNQANNQANNQPKLGYQQQLEQRVRASSNNGVILALPWLCDRLKLSLFEKNLILMGLAPEVNRRYTRLYRYLQSHDEHVATDLPSVELILRLLCHNDQEWRRARVKLAPDAALIRHNLVALLYQPHDPFLNATVRLSDDLVDCLLAETPDPDDLERLINLDGSLTSGMIPLPDGSQWPVPEVLSVDFSKAIAPDHPVLPGKPLTGTSIPSAVLPPGTPTEATSSDAVIGGVSSANNRTISDIESSSSTATNTSAQFKSTDIPAPSWDDLIVPPSLLGALRHIGQRLTLHETVNQTWAIKRPSINPVPPGLITIFAGAPGTGKSLASGILAHELSSPLYCVDLASVMDIDYLQLIEELDMDSPKMLLIQSAEQWLGRASAMPPTRLLQFLNQRRQQVSLTIMTVGQLETVAHSWQQQVDQTLVFPLPTDVDRQTLWSQSFPPKLNLSRTIDWPTLCQIPLSGGEIRAIAYDAMVRVVADQAKTLKVAHLVGALQWHGVAECEIQQFVGASGPSRTRTSNRKAVATPSKSKSSTGTAQKRSTSKQRKSAKAASSKPSTLPRVPPEKGVSAESSAESSPILPTTSSVDNTSTANEAEAEAKMSQLPEKRMSKGTSKRKPKAGSKTAPESVITTKKEL